jgi:hypothetical protein
MKKTLAALFMLFFIITAHATEPAKVMLIGTFHFSNPGKDVVKVDDVDVLDVASQQFLQQFAERLAGFKPTRVLLEYDPANEALINQRYSDYLAGTYELGVNEIYQLGFRIAKLSGLKAVQSFDHTDLQWQAEAMFEYAKQHDSPEMKTFNESIERVTQEEAQARATENLRGLLMRANDEENDRQNMDLYLTTNAIGVGDGYAGADATASWWQRNFRMYANIQQAAQPGERLIVIGGQGHTAILKQLLRIDQRLQKEKVDGYF